MHSAAKCLLGLAVLSFTLLGCGEKPIGQPCNFGWPKTATGDVDCSGYPSCHPLQASDKSPKLNNGACPIDCIQMPSLECENLICVATQIEGDSGHMNGVCWDPAGGEPDPNCPSSGIRCMGYCTKECLTDAGCPKEYHCSAMAPFGATLQCQNEEEWDTSCTASCKPAGTEGCPTSGANANYSSCDLKENADCCACICYRFCPILKKKFCRRKAWNDDLFKDAVVDPGLGCAQD